MIRGVVSMKDGSELVLLGITESDVKFFRSGRGMRYSPAEMRKAGMRRNNVSVALVYGETEGEIIEAVKRTGAEVESIYETPGGDIRDPGSD